MNLEETASMFLWHMIARFHGSGIEFPEFL